MRPVGEPYAVGSDAHDKNAGIIPCLIESREALREQLLPLPPLRTFHHLGSADDLHGAHRHRKTIIDGCRDLLALDDSAMLDAVPKNEKVKRHMLSQRISRRRSAHLAVHPGGEHHRPPPAQILLNLVDHKLPRLITSQSWRRHTSLPYLSILPRRIDRGESTFLYVGISDGREDCLGCGRWE